MVEEAGLTAEVGLGDEDADADEDEEDCDAAEFKAADSRASRPLIAPRWPTRVFAAQCVRRIIASCATSPQAAAHFDLARAKEEHLTRSRGGQYFIETFNHKYVQIIYVLSELDISLSLRLLLISLVARVSQVNYFLYGGNIILTGIKFICTV